MKPKIIMFSNLDLWSIEEGKGAPSFYNTVKAYADAKWDITLIQPISKYRKAYTVDNCKMVKFNNTFFDFFNRIPKLRFFMRFFMHAYMKHQFIKKTQEIIEKEKGKYVLYAYEIYAVAAAKKLSKKYNIPFVTRFQGTILTNYQVNFMSKIKKYPHFGALKQKSDLVIMTDDGTKGEEVLKRLNNSTSNILFWKNGQNPIKTEAEVDKARKELRKKLNIKDNATVLLTVSRLKNWKKVERAIMALKEVAKEYPDTKLIIVGDGEEFDNLNNLTKTEGLDKQVIFTGAVKQEDVWKYYSCADIFLSLYDLSNVGNPLMEAMRYGKAIVTLNNGDTSDIIKNNDTGILLSPDELNKVPGEIIKLIKNNKTIIKLGQNALHYAEKNFWTWDDRMKAEVAEVKKLLK